MVKLTLKQRLAIMTAALILVAAATWQFRKTIILKPDFVGLVQIGDAEGVEMQLKCKPDLITTECDTEIKGYLPIHRAARTGNVELLKILIRHGSLLSQSDSFGWSPLQYAVVYEHHKVAGLLAGSGAGWDEEHFPRSTDELAHQFVARENQYRREIIWGSGSHPSFWDICCLSSGKLLMGKRKITKSKMVSITKQISHIDREQLMCLRIEDGKSETARGQYFFVCRVWRQFIKSRPFTVDLSITEPLELSIFGIDEIDHVEEPKVGP